MAEVLDISALQEELRRRASLGLSADHFEIEHHQWAAFVRIMTGTAATMDTNSRSDPHIYGLPVHLVPVGSIGGVGWRLLPETVER